MGIRCLHHRLASHFQTWSMSIGFKMEPLRGNCKVMWFSININAQGYATGAMKHNLFYLPSDPSHICQSIQIDLIFHIPDAAEVGIKKGSTFIQLWISLRRICCTKNLNFLR